MQYLIANQMAIGVIYGFEMVKVNDTNATWLTCTWFSCIFVGENPKESLAVENSLVELPKNKDDTINLMTFL